jgi:hypothetical protein
MARRRRPAPDAAVDARALEHPEFVAYWAGELTRWMLIGRWGMAAADELRLRLPRLRDDQAVIEFCEQLLRDRGRLDVARRRVASGFCAVVRFQRTRGHVHIPDWQVAAAAALEVLYPPIHSNLAGPVVGAVPGRGLSQRTLAGGEAPFTGCDGSPPVGVRAARPTDLTTNPKDTE